MRSDILQQILDETPKDINNYVDLWAKLYVRINQIVRDKKLSTLDETSELYKWQNGEYNLFLRSFAKLEMELGETILDIIEK